MVGNDVEHSAVALRRSRPACSAGDAQMTCGPPAARHHFLQ